jgi:hypothetical protein
MFYFTCGQLFEIQFFYLFSNNDFVKNNCILCLCMKPHMLCGHDVHICCHLMILCTLNGSLRLVQLFVMHSELFNKEDLFLCVRAFNRNPVVRLESPSFQESSDRRVCSHIGTIAFLRPPFNIWIRATLSENFIVMRHQQETFHHAHNYRYVGKALQHVNTLMSPLCQKMHSRCNNQLQTGSLWILSTILRFPA